MCGRHGVEFLEYKCRFCCSIAVYFWWEFKYFEFFIEYFFGSTAIVSTLFVAIRFATISCLWCEHSFQFVLSDRLDR